MPVDEIETRYCRFVDDVVNHHHLDRLAEYMTPDVIVHAPGAPAGVAGARQVLASYFTAFPDFHLAIDAVLALDGELLARLSATGTHRGRFLGVAPTGQRVSVCALEAWRLRDGQCAEHWLQLDLVGLLQQLGAVVPAEAAPSRQDRLGRSIAALDEFQLDGS
jgi:predicted ester cyclase